MKKAILIEAEQDSAIYSIPAWHARILTYPLPPYSTVIGMIHAACGWKEYHPLRVSVSGSGIQNQELATMWKGGMIGIETEEFKKRFPVRFPVGDGKVVGWISKPVYRDFMADIKLRLHIMPETEGEDEKILDKILYPDKYLSLGRSEDLIRIKKAQIVQIRETSRSVKLCMDTYIPREYIEEKTGGLRPSYAANLHKDYKIIKNRRIFNDVPTTYVGSGHTVTMCGDNQPTNKVLVNTMMIDDFKNPVFFA